MWNLSSRFVAQGSDFVKALSLCSVQFCGTVKSALLPPLSPSLLHPQPPTMSDPIRGQIQISATIAAGESGPPWLLSTLAGERHLNQILTNYALKVQYMNLVKGSGSGKIGNDV